jgi:hypothetical protein
MAKKNRGCLFFVWIIGLGSIQANAELKTAASADEISKIQSALNPIKKSFMETLQTAMASGQVDQAIEACHLKAPSIAEAAAPAGMLIGRTSHKVRNSKNKPKKWMEELFSKFPKVAPKNAVDLPYQVVRLSSNRLGYLEPIYTKPMCLMCHGKEIAPSVLSKIKALYPNDLATGFDVGELRGYFWVELQKGLTPKK